MRVLVVDDDRALGHFLGEGLKMDGHEVEVVGDGEAALASAARTRPDLMILDLSLPRKDGVEVLAEMKKLFQSTSVLVLTARAELDERVRCLENGADDVVLKPFSFHELRARVKAVHRRRSEDTLLQFGDLEMDRAQRRVTQAGREIELTATEFSLLESLLRRRGERVCSRAELLSEVWRTQGGLGTNIVEVYINYLRKKLSALSEGAGFADNRCVIRTVRGKGYLLGKLGVAGQRIPDGLDSSESERSYESGGWAAEGWVASV